VVVDPQRDIAQYLADAAAEGVVIERVIETHVHADFLSGHLELAAATGARIAFGAAAQVEFPIDRLDDGERLSLGEVELEIRHTPGHTPESICIVIHAGEQEPYGVLTGDTLFIGDVGRPDLSAPRAGPPTTWPGPSTAPPARSCSRSRTPPACSRARGRVGVRQEPVHRDEQHDRRATPHQLRAGADERGRVRRRRLRRAVHGAVLLRPRLAGQPAGAPVPRRDEPGRRAADVPDGAVVVDTRDPRDFAAGHLDGAINVGLAGRFAEMAGEVVAADRDIVLVAEPDTATEARNRLARIGFDRVVGYLPVTASPVDRLRAASRLTATQLAAGGTPRRAARRRARARRGAHERPGARRGGRAAARAGAAARRARPDEADGRVLRGRLPLLDRPPRRCGRPGSPTCPISSAGSARGTTAPARSNGRGPTGPAVRRSGRAGWRSRRGTPVESAARPVTRSTTCGSTAGGQRGAEEGEQHGGRVEVGGDLPTLLAAPHVGDHLGEERQVGVVHPAAGEPSQISSRVIDRLVRLART
jgi:rhodanese-related sulfurtransferase